MNAAAEINKLIAGLAVAAAMVFFGMIVISMRAGWVKVRHPAISKVIAGTFVVCIVITVVGLTNHWFRFTAAGTAGNIDGWSAAELNKQMRRADAEALRVKATTAELNDQIARLKQETAARDVEIFGLKEEVKSAQMKTAVSEQKLESIIKEINDSSGMGDPLGRKEVAEHFEMLIKQLHDMEDKLRTKEQELDELKRRTKPDKLR